MTPFRSAILLLSATLLLAGCGQRGGLLPADDAQALLADIERIESAVTSGDCASVPAAVSDAQQRASELPSSVDRRLRSRIEEGLARLTTLAPRDCLEARTTTTTTTATTQTTQTSTTTTQTTPTPTQTTPPPQPTQTTPPPQPTQTTPQPTQTTPPPSGGTPSGGGTGGASPDTGGATP